jgi:hypothetical protein
MVLSWSVVDCCDCVSIVGIGIDVFMIGMPACPGIMHGVDFRLLRAGRQSHQKRGESQNESQGPSFPWYWYRGRM